METNMKKYKKNKYNHSRPLKRKSEDKCEEEGYMMRKRTMTAEN